MASPKEFRLRGGNAEAFQWRRSGEYVLAGPGGTGKTVANLLHLLHFGQTYPGARLLILRKTRASLTESALVTWERDILGDGHPIIGNPINRGNRQNYRFPNTTQLVTGGIDRPDKLLSTEFDLIYVPEANELSLAEWETLGGRLRAGAGPYDLLFGDVNPTTPTHWIYRRAQAGKLKLISTTHKDNPRYWDVDRQEWTEAGLRYLTRLRTMTGARKKRFLLGEWAAAEGLVYDGYSPSIHDLPDGWEPPSGWERIWCLDFGFSNPLVLGMWAIDGDGRLYLYREYYLTETRVETLAKMVKADCERRGEPAPAAVVCDHDPENAATWDAYAGLRINATMADKQRRDEGIEEVQGRFDIQGDGRPRIFLGANCLAHVADQKLMDAGKPTRLSEELVSYVWDLKNPDRLKDEPLKVGDHHCDALRYLSRWVSTYRSGNIRPYGGAKAPTTLPALRPRLNVKW